jgi:glycosyltransferase involved in cell wall biosynthesis
MSEGSERGAVFVMPRHTNEWASAKGVWIAAAGWAAAARRRYGHGWVATPDGVFDPDEVLRRTASVAIPQRSSMTRRSPEVAKTFVKDVRRWRIATRYRVEDDPTLRDARIEFVWQHHDLFHRAGELLAQACRCPLVSFVHAPQVWEARSWGVARPGWGPLLERYGERPQLVASDVVVCVSDVVRTEVVRLGVPRERTVVCPTGVDAEHFGPQISGQRIRAQFDLMGRFVVGWIGSFRSFHGLEGLLDAFATLHREIASAQLLLVGGGPALESVRKAVRQRDLGDAVVFAGEAPHREVPEFLAAMDVAVVNAPKDEAFHYSPQKLREYMAAQVAVVAPKVGDVADLARDGEEALLFDAGDTVALTARLLELANDAQLRDRVARAGRARVLVTGTWDAQLEHLVTSDAFAAAVTMTHSPGSDS